MEPIKLLQPLQEAYVVLGFGAFILVIFIIVFIVLINRNLKLQDKLLDKYEKLSEGVDTLNGNDERFERLVNQLVEAVKELSTTNRIVADTVSKLDFYNKNFHKQLEKHDEKADKIIDKLNS